MSVPRFVLASASPARLATLRRAGFSPDVVVSGVDEDGVDAGSAAATALELATRKGAAVASGLSGEVVVLGCDSVLEFDGGMWGKPGTAEAATDRWRRMRGRDGILHTGHCLTRVGDAGSRVVTAVASTTVRFADLDDEEIAAYVATGEPLQVAGAFTVDGLGGWFVEAVDGDPHNVVGVSLPLLRRMLADLDVRVTDLWS